MKYHDNMTAEQEAQLMAEVKAIDDAYASAQPKLYRVAWIIDVEDDSPAGAVRQALEAHRDPESLAVFYDVTEVDRSTQRTTGRTVTINADTFEVEPFAWNDDVRADPDAELRKAALSRGRP